MNIKFSDPLRSAIVRDMLQEMDRGIDLYGDWSDYTPEQMIEALKGEFEEVNKAAGVGDLTDSEHSMAVELVQLSAICLKGAMQLRRKEKVAEVKNVC